MSFNLPKPRSLHVVWGMPCMAATSRTRPRLQCSSVARAWVQLSLARGPSWAPCPQSSFSEACSSRHGRLLQCLSLGRLGRTLTFSCGVTFHCLYFFYLLSFELASKYTDNFVF